MGKFIITIKDPKSNMTKVHHVDGFNMQLIQKRSEQGIMWKNHKDDATTTEEVAMMINNLLEQYPDLTLEMLKR